jgi:hypothetical protein
MCPNNGTSSSRKGSTELANYDNEANYPGPVIRLKVLNQLHQFNDIQATSYC